MSLNLLCIIVALAYKTIANRNFKWKDSFRIKVTLIRYLHEYKNICKPIRSYLYYNIILINYILFIDNFLFNNSNLQVNIIKI
jgi:hypothetical protein